MKAKVIKVAQNIRDVDVEIPQFTKAFFCIPLRPALMAWGVLLLGALTYVQVRAIHRYMEAHFGNMGTVMFVIGTGVTIVEMLFAGSVVWLTAKKHQWKCVNGLYNYQVVKVLAYAALLAVSIMLDVMIFSDDWYYRHLDPVRYYLLRENVFAGMLDLMLNFYLALLLRSYVSELGGTPGCLFKRKNAEDVNNDKKAFVEIDIPEEKAEKSDGYGNPMLYAVG